MPLGDLGDLGSSRTTERRPELPRSRGSLGDLGPKETSRGNHAVFSTSVGFQPLAILRRDLLHQF